MIVQTMTIYFLFPNSEKFTNEFQKRMFQMIENPSEMVIMEKFQEEVGIFDNNYIEN